MIRRISALVLCILMALTAVPAGAYAAAGSLYSATRSEEARARLSELTDGGSDAAYELMDSLGLLGATGELDLAKKIVLDGESLTLEQAEALVSDEACDLSRVAEVDGASVSLRDLKTMFEIEAELARIEETYFSDREMTEEQLLGIESLVSALEGGRVRILGAAAPVDATLPIEIDLSALEESTAFNIDAAAARTLENNEAFSREVICGDCMTVPAGRSVSFKLRIDYGLLPSASPSGLFTYSIEAYGDPACGGAALARLELPLSEGNANSGTFTVDNSAGDAAISVSLRIRISKAVRTSSSDYTYMLTLLLDNEFNSAISGSLTGMLTFLEPQGCVFKSSDTDTGKFLYQKPVVIERDYAFYISSASTDDVRFLPWRFKTSYTGNYMLGPASSTSARWPLIRSNVSGDLSNTAVMSISEREEIALYYTAGEVYGPDPDGDGTDDDDSWYLLDAVTTLLHNDGDITTKHNGVGPWVDMAPRPADIGGNPLPFTIYTLRNRLEPASSVPTPPTGMNYFGYTDVLGDYSRLLDNPLYADLIAVFSSSTLGDNRSVLRCKGQPYCMVMLGTPTENEITSDSYNTISPSAITQSVTKSYSVSVFDTTAPTVAAITAPAGTYASGQRIPIRIEFSEPVITAPDGKTAISLTINGVPYTANDLLMDSTGKFAVAWYTVKELDTVALTVSSVSNITDLSVQDIDNAEPNITAVDNNGGEGWTLAGVTLSSALMRNAVSGVSAQYANGVVTITAAVNQLTEYANKYTQARFVAVVTDPAGVQSDIELTQADDSEGRLIYVGTLGGVTLTSAEQTYAVGIRVYENSADAGTRISVRNTFTVPARVNVTGVTVSSDVPAVTELVISDAYRPTLSRTVAPENASYQTGEWSSSDADIATISQDGVVTLTGTKVGSVSFIYTADNGTPDVTTDDIEGSITYSVTAGDFVALTVPSNAATVFVRQNAPATVYWNTNAVLLGAAAVSPFVKVYGGDYASAEALNGLTPVWESDSAVAGNSLQIPQDVLSTLSLGRTPAYTVLFSAANPVIAGDTLTALAHIVVNPVPAKATLTRPASLFITDDESVRLSWSIENFISSGADPTRAELTVVRVTGDSEETVFATPTVNAATGSYTLTPSAVPAGSLREAYIVNLSAQNQGDETAHVDGFLLYVYNRSALRLQYSDGTDMPAEITIDNTSTVSGYTAESQSTVNGSDTEDLLALREELGLIEYIAVNYKDYPWSRLLDRIRWETTNGEISVNYRQGSLYENIALYGLEDYLPQSDMAVASVVDGSAVITATHANTGMSASVEVNVSTLRREFYLFQLTPAIETALTYTDGRGDEKTVMTNSDGVLALYEPNGIASDIALKATDARGDVYLGTIYEENLLSGERDARTLQLYPLNTFKLRRVARVELSLTNPDGTPFSGTLSLRGGVYKNGKYCQDALLSGTDYSSLRDGKRAQSVTVTNGAVTFYFDSTQFWSGEAGESSADAAGLSAKDNIKYIFELSNIESDAYLPMLVYVDGNLTTYDIMRSGESVLTLEAAFAGGVKKPFLSNQYMDYGLSAGRLVDVRGSKGHVGPSATYALASLRTTYLLWGETSADGYTLTLSDEFRYSPIEQESHALVYPFSSIPAVENTLTLNEATMTDSGWIADGDDVGLRSRLEKNGSVVSDSALPFRAIDMTRVAGVEWSGTAKSLVKDVEDALAAPDIDMSGSGVSGAILEFVVDTLDGASGPLDTSKVKMLISPGADNSVFNAFVWVGYDGIGLADANYSNDGIAVDTATSKQSLGLDIGMSTLKSMAAGEYFDPDNIYNKMLEGYNSPSRFSASPKFQVEGYYEFELRYDPERDDWTAQTLGGGFTAGVGVAINYIMNGSVGPVPVTAEFSFKGSVELSFKAATRYTEIAGNAWEDPDAGSVTDFLTTLRASAYVYAFGGFGFDYTVLALKVGLFGGLTVDNSNRFLSREYLDDGDERQKNGQQLHIEGEVGVRFVAKFLFISYSATLGSVNIEGTYDFNDWDDIDDYWEGNRSVATAMRTYARQTGMRITSGSAALTSRDYLQNDGARQWSGGRPRSSAAALDGANGLSALQTNANPDSLPLVSDDGELLIYVSDQTSASIYDSRVFAGTLQGGAYTEGSALPAPTDAAAGVDFTGFGDSSLSFDGDSSFAAAAWVRLAERIPDRDAGDEVTAEEIAILSSGAEIVASVWDGASWSSARLTVNTMPDLAPTVAVIDNKALVAWRSAFSDNPSDATDFTAYDTVLYSIYTAADGWSAPKQLYNGSAGAVMGLSAAMLENGTAAVAYALERADGDAATADTEIAYTIIDTSAAPDAQVGATVFATSDGYADENPQLAAVRFGASDERFVLGWYSLREDGGDVRLLAVNADGAISNVFPSSVAQLAQGVAAEVSADFSFARMAEGANGVSRLTVLYTGRVNDADGNIDHSTLNAIRLRVGSDGSIAGLTAPAEIAEMPARTLLDHTDAYVDAGGQVKAVLQGTWYDPVNEVNNVPLEETRLFTATGALTNAVELTGLMADYGTLALNTLAPIRFTVSNAGIDVMTEVAITLDGTTDTFSGLSIAPNESEAFTCYRNTGNSIRNLSYSLSAEFEGGGTASAQSGVVYLDYPDIGIANMEVIGESEGLRTVRLTLYNSAAATLAGGKGRNVHIGFYADSDRANAANIACTADGVTCLNNELVISGESALALIDRGVYTLEVTYDVRSRSSVFSGGEIPDGGLRLYASAWTTEGVRTTAMPEYDALDNDASVLLESLLRRTGEAVTLEVEQGTGAGVTTALVNIRNNSLQSVSNGALVATLLDGDGNALETKQLSLPAALAGEESASEAVSFTRSGSRVAVTFGTVAPQDSARLSGLTFDGLSVQLSDFTPDANGNYTASLTSVLVDSTLVSFVTESADAAVKINGVAANSGTRVNIPYGSSKIVISVSDGSERAEYTLNLLSAHNPSTDAGVSAVSVGGKAGVISGTTISVVLDRGTALPTDASAVAITAAADAVVSNLRTSDGGATWRFTVTAQDGVTSVDYTVNVTVTPSPARRRTAYYDIEASAGAGGRISPAGTVKVAKGGDIWFYFMPDEGYEIDAVVVDGYAVTDSPYCFENVTGDHAIYVTFKLAEVPSAPAVFHTVTVTAEGQGSVSPSGSMEVEDGGSQSFTLLPDEGHALDAVYVNGEAREISDGQLVLENITEDIELRAVFAPIPEAPADTPAETAPHCFICKWFGRDIAPWCWLTPLIVVFLGAAVAAAYFILRRRDEEE